MAPGKTRTLLISGLIPLEKAPYNIMEVASCTGSRQLTREAQEWVDGFCEDIFLGLMQYGAVSEIQLAFNSAPHLMGNVWVVFATPDEATRALEGLNERFYAEHAVSARLVQLSRDMRGSRCRQYDEWLRGVGAGCRKGSDCNFVHMLQPSDGLLAQLFAASDRKWGRSPADRAAARQARPLPQRRRPDARPGQGPPQRVQREPPRQSGGLW